MEPSKLVVANGEAGTLEVLGNSFSPNHVTARAMFLRALQSLDAEDYPNREEIN